MVPLATKLARQRVSGRPTQVGSNPRAFRQAVSRSWHNLHSGHQSRHGRSCGYPLADGTNLLVDSHGRVESQKTSSGQKIFQAAPFASLNAHGRWMRALDSIPEGSRPSTNSIPRPVSVIYGPERLSDRVSPWPRKSSELRSTSHAAEKTSFVVLVRGGWQSLRVCAWTRFRRHTAGR